ncbi:MAG: hypothetical protein WDA29_08795 [Flavobacteriaceae bacterium]
MGLLDQTTNSIILDMVLTDKGREALSRSDGSFSVVKFALQDTGVDYSIIQKFGRTIGMEKIEKNTPILEALTNGSLEQMHKLVSISNPNLIRLPNLVLTGEGVDSTNNNISIGSTSAKSRTITIAQNVTNEASIDVELRDQVFIVEMANQFLQISGTTPDSVNNMQRAQYLLTRDAGETSIGGSRVSFTLTTKSITESQYQIYGTSSNKNQIVTFLKVTGVQSGATIEFQATIDKNI